MNIGQFKDVQCHLGGYPEKEAHRFFSFSTSYSNGDRLNSRQDGNFADKTSFSN